MRKLSFLAGPILGLLLIVLIVRPSAAVPPTAHGDDYQAPIAETTAEQRQATLDSMTIPAGMQKSLFAAEPMIVNPVAFGFDHQGRVFVAETFRQAKGVEDNRGHMYWLHDDLAAQTVADREAYMKKHHADALEKWTAHQDRIRLLVDRDGDGQADEATIFAGGFNEMVEGTGAGVLFHQGALYYTCIPRLWRLQDTTGDGQADTREVLHDGYGVRFAFRGHDLHGLCVGPDGKIYYSIGDRGYHITTPAGTLVDPETGAVFRCNPDGSELEVFATGLRNPQELAFDKYGNLFTGDNNSDSGDRARWVYVVEGGDTGWRMAYQYFNDRGPWNREKLWHTYHEGQPAYVVPPIAYLGNGPSGVTYYPGTGLAERYNDHFFMCEFRGGAANSGVLSLSVEPDGAFFKMGPVEEMVWSVLATDVDFGPDSQLYISDWVSGWEGAGMGRLYRISDPEALQDPAVAETKKLLAAGMAERPASELLTLLAHKNMKVRLAAQFELAARGGESIAALEKVAQTSEHQLARIHALWGLGQIARTVPQALAIFQPLLEDGDAEIRGQVAKLLGDHRHADATAALVDCLSDESLRVRYFAAQSLGKLKVPSAIAPLAEMLRENADQDPMLRHAGVMGLTGTGDVAALVALANDPSASVRMGALLALRRLESPELVRFLNDPQPLIVEEAARAIHDLPINDVMPQLAALISQPDLTSDALLRRLLNANFRLGTAAHAQAVAQYAARSDAPEAMRVEAVRMLAEWSEPTPIDRVLGMWRPLESRNPEIARRAIRAALPGLMTANDAVRGEAVQAAAKLGITEIGPTLVRLAENKSEATAQRVAAIEALLALKDSQLERVMRAALDDHAPAMRAAGRRVLAQLHPAEAVAALQAALENGTQLEQQRAFSTLATLEDGRVNPILSTWMERLLAGQVATAIELDLLEAAALRKAAPLIELLERYEAARPQDDPLAAYQETLQGGDAERGSEIFYYRAQVSCVRCHAIGSTGGEVGPDLTRLGGEKDRRYLLEAIVDPNRTIAKGYGTVMLILDSGKIVSGIVREEDDEAIRLITADGSFVEVAQDEIDERLAGQSAMPADIATQLTKRDLRDLVEFLAQQK